MDISQTLALMEETANSISSSINEMYDLELSRWQHGTAATWYVKDPETNEKIEMTALFMRYSKKVDEGRIQLDNYQNSILEELVAKGVLSSQEMEQRKKRVKDNFIAAFDDDNYLLPELSLIPAIEYQLETVRNAALTKTRNN